MASWYKPWHPPGLDEVRKTVDAVSSSPRGEGLDPLSPDQEAKFSARREQSVYEATEQAREEGRRESLNKDQFKEGWDAGQAEIRRQNEARRAARSAVPKVPSARRRGTGIPRMRSTGSIGRASSRSMGSAFKRKR